jgi:hypothetical protein
MSSYFILPEIFSSCTVIKSSNMTIAARKINTTRNLLLLNCLSTSTNDIFENDVFLWFHPKRLNHIAVDTKIKNGSGSQISASVPAKCSVARNRISVSIGSLNLSRPHICAEELRTRGGCTVTSHVPKSGDGAIGLSLCRGRCRSYISKRTTCNREKEGKAGTLNFIFASKSVGTKQAQYNYHSKPHIGTSTASHYTPKGAI